MESREKETTSRAAGIFDLGAPLVVTLIEGWVVSPRAGGCHGARHVRHLSLKRTARIDNVTDLVCNVDYPTGASPGSMGFFLFTLPASVILTLESIGYYARE